MANRSQLVEISLFESSKFCKSIQYHGKEAEKLGSLKDQVEAVGLGRAEESGRAPSRQLAAKLAAQLAAQSADHWCPAGCMLGWLVYGMVFR